MHDLDEKNSKQSIGGNIFLKVYLKIINVMYKKREYGQRISEVFPYH